MGGLRGGAVGRVVGISGIFFSPPLAAIKKKISLFRVFLLEKVLKNVDFRQFFRKNSKIVLKIRAKRAMFTFQKKIAAFVAEIFCLGWVGGCNSTSGGTAGGGV